MKRTIQYLGIGVIAAIVITFASCSDDDKSLPPINGFNNADEVAQENLLAHWTFDGTNNEKLSGTAPSTANANSFTTGVKGQALALNEGFLLYPTISALSSANALGSVTVSAWVYTDNRVDKATAFFNITEAAGTQSDWNRGPVLLMAETGKPLTKNDTLVLKGVFSTRLNGTVMFGDNINDFGVRGTDFQTVKGTNRWVHFVFRYDGNGSFIDLYADGVRVSNNNFRERKYNNGTADVGIGPLVSPTPTQVLIGSFANASAGFPNSANQTWQGKLKGNIDEIRVYNKALTDNEIGSLYQLELAGR